MKKVFNTRISSVSKRSLYIICAVVVAMGLMVGLGIRHRFVGNASKKQNAESTKESERIPGVDYSAGSKEDNQSINDKKTDGSLDTTPTSDGSISVSFSRADQKADKTVQVRLLVSGTATGTCTLTFSKGSATVVKTADVVNRGNYYSCEGFDVPISEFPLDGQWRATAVVDKDAKQATATQEMTISK